MRRILLSLVLAVAVAGPGITWIGPAGAADATITVTDRADPAALTVAPGTQVTFVNQSGERKRFRSEDGPAEFDSGNIEAGASWSVVLDAVGTYPYVDDRDRDDPAYHGTITVSAAGQPGGGSPNPPGSPQSPAGSPAPSAPAAASVAILDRSFSPGTVTVAPGGTVSWANQSDRDHTVTGTGFDSGVVGGGGRFSHTFPSAGTFTYICELHSEMRATVTVAGSTGPAQPGPSPATTAPAPAPAAPAPAVPAPQPPAAAGAAGATRHDVVLVDYAFRPGSISARAGDSVVWTNQGRAPHTATAPGAFDTGLFRAGEQRTTTLRTPGTFAFACTVHPEMSGVLKVAAATGGSAPAASPGLETAAGPTTSSPSSTSTTAPTAPLEAAAPEAAEVSVVDLAFEPATVRLAAGGTVTWRHNGIAPHTVTAEDSSFDSGLLQAGGSFSLRFDRTGTFRYICAFHTQMAGTVEIVDRSSPPVPDLDATNGEQAAASVRSADGGSWPGGAAVLAALLGGAALLAGTGALLYGGSRMLAAGDRP
ncbi:MAG TPA: plastocyanin/azurin family copper-binding protein [Acidimicrobiia bacterium]|nr:plastocyanin/azurin family copper-binding protein [Acidimicrobiia bacterium]